MGNWIGEAAGQARSAKARIPAKRHRNVSLVKTSDPLVAEEILARPKLSKWIIGRLSPDILLIQPGHAEEVIEELRKIGHTPKIEGAR